MTRINFKNSALQDADDSSILYEIALPEFDDATLAMQQFITSIEQEIEWQQAREKTVENLFSSFDTSITGFVNELDTNLTQVSNTITGIIAAIQNEKTAVTDATDQLNKLHESAGQKPTENTGSGDRKKIKNIIDDGTKEMKGATDMAKNITGTAGEISGLMGEGAVATAIPVVGELIAAGIVAVAVVDVIGTAAEKLGLLGGKTITGHDPQWYDLIRMGSYSGSAQQMVDDVSPNGYKVDEMQKLLQDLADAHNRGTGYFSYDLVDGGNILSKKQTESFYWGFQFYNNDPYKVKFDEKNYPALPKAIKLAIDPDSFKSGGYFDKHLYSSEELEVLRAFATSNENFKNYLSKIPFQQGNYYQYIFSDQPKTGNNLMQYNSQVLGGYLIPKGTNGLPIVSFGNSLTNISVPVAKSAASTSTFGQGANSHVKQNNQANTNSYLHITNVPSASRPTTGTTINIKIENLMKGDVKIESQTVTEGAGKLQMMIANALMAAVNDSQIIRH